MIMGTSRIKSREAHDFETNGPLYRFHGGKLDDANILRFSDNGNYFTWSLAPAT